MFVYPALTLCFLNTNSSIDIKNVFLQNQFTFANITQTAGDFDISTRFSLACMTFNGGFNSSGHKIDIFKSNIYSWGNIIFFEFLLPLQTKILYFISDNLQRPGLDDLTEGLQTMPSLQILRFRKTIEKKLGEPYNQCLKTLEKAEDFESVAFQQVLNNSKYKYSRNNCLDQCRLNLYNEKHNNTNVTPDDIILFIQDKCYGECPENCDRTIYTSDLFTEISSAYITPTERDKYPNMDCDEFDQRIFRLGLTSQYLTYYYITQVPQMTATNLFSSIGGLAGLFLGVSVMNTYQVIVLIVKLTLERVGYVKT